MTSDNFAAVARLRASPTLTVANLTSLAKLHPDNAVHSMANAQCMISKNRFHRWPKMSKLPEFTSPPIQPIYWQDHPNQPIEFGTHSAELETPTGNIAHDVKVRLSFSPDTSLEFVITLDENRSLEDRVRATFSPRPSKYENLKWTATGTVMKVFRISSGSEEIILTPTETPISPYQPATGLKSAILSIFNFPDFWSSQDCGLKTQTVEGTAWTRLGMHTLRADGWRIIIVGQPTTSVNSKALEKSGGMATTHVMKIERENGDNFSSEELQHTVSVVQRFLSFVTGRWAAVSPTAAFDENGNRIWENWGLGLASRDAWAVTHSWFDPHHGDALSNVFPGFYTRCNHPLWKAELWKTI